MQEIAKSKLTPEQKAQAEEACKLKYSKIKEAQISKAIGSVQKSAAKAQNNPAYSCNAYSYALGCKDGYYLKDFAEGCKPLSALFANQEMPRCPFDEDGSKGYFYYIAADGQVYCTCPYCSPYGNS